MKAPLTAVILMGVASMASAQIMYSGGTYTQNFNTLSSNTDGGILDLDKSDPWTDNSTLASWYANRDSYTTAPDLLLGIGLDNKLTSAGTGSDRSLGSYLGVASLLDPVSYGIRIQNNLGSPMTQFTLAFDTESTITGLTGVLGATLLDSFNLAYSTTATDVTGAGAMGYQLIDGSANLLSLSILTSSVDSARLEVTIGNLNIAQGEDLWIRWERSGLLGITDTSLSIDNLEFSAVPEPSTYLMLVLGLSLLFTLKGRRRAPTKPKSFRLFSLLALALSAPLAQAQFSAPHLDASASPGTPVSIADNDHLLIQQADGTSRQIKPGSKAQRITLPDGDCLVSYGKNKSGEPVIVLSPDVNATQPVRILVQGTLIEVSEDAVATVTLKKNAPAPEINPGYTGKIRVNGQLLPARDPIATDAAKTEGKTLYLYDPEWETCRLEKDFATERALDLENGRLAVLNPPKFNKSGPYFLAAVDAGTPPKIVWLRQQSYLRMKRADPETGLQNASYAPQEGTAQMKTLGHRELFGGAVDPSQRTQLFFRILPDLLRGTRQTQGLLQKASRGQATTEDLRSLQQTGRVIWVVKCRLVEDLTPPDGDPDPIKDAITESLQVRLVPVATTPF